MSVRNLAVETLRCPACGAAEGVECNTVVNGEQTHWTHDARWTAKFMADVRTSVTSADGSET